VFKLILHKLVLLILKLLNDELMSKKYPKVIITTYLIKGLFKD